MKPSEQLKDIYEASLVRYAFVEDTDCRTLGALVNTVVKAGEVMDGLQAEIKDLRENNRCRCEYCVADRT